MRSNDKLHKNNPDTLSGSLYVTVKMAAMLQCYIVVKRDPIPDFNFLGSLRSSSQIAVLGGRWILQAKSLDKVYSMCWYPFMNNNACQIYFIQHQI